MGDFLRFFEKISDKYHLQLEICYSEIADWNIVVYLRDLSDTGSDFKIFDVSDCDMELCFARAQVAMKDWLFENKGGY